MLEEFNHKLAVDCDELYSAIIDDVVAGLLEHFVYRAIPEDNADCDEFVEYLGRYVFSGSGTLKDMPGVNYEAGQFVRAAIAELDDSERFVVDCYFVENIGKLPTEDDLMHSIMSHLDTVLYEIGRRLQEQISGQ